MTLFLGIVSEHIINLTRLYTWNAQPVDRKQWWTNHFQYQEDGIVAEVSAKTEASGQINTETLRAANGSRQWLVDNCSRNLEDQGEEEAETGQIKSWRDFATIEETYMHD